MMHRPAMLALACAVGLAACGGSDDGGAADDGERPVAERIEEIQSAVDSWAAAESMDAARAAAETVVNLVSGPNGTRSGDLDGDGIVRGQSAVGLLSGADGTPEGLAVSLADNPCVVRDVLGSTAEDPAAGWAETEAAIEAWRPDANTMPTLLSHPMRVVGWASFTLDTDDLDDAHEYAGHAQLHVDVSRSALDCDG